MMRFALLSIFRFRVSHAIILTIFFEFLEFSGFYRDDVHESACFCTCTFIRRLLKSIVNGTHVLVLC